MTLRVWDLHQDPDRQRLLFTQRLPALWEKGQQSPLWDFDFRCVKDSGDCWTVVPSLSMTLSSEKSRID